MMAFSGLDNSLLTSARPPCALAARERSSAKKKNEHVESGLLAMGRASGLHAINAVVNQAMLIALADRIEIGLCSGRTLSILPGALSGSATPSLLGKAYSRLFWLAAALSKACNPPGRRLRECDLHELTVRFPRENAIQICEIHARGPLLYAGPTR